MPRFRASRKSPSELSVFVQRQLNSYALTAAAAGMSALALVQPGWAEVVYTPADHIIEPREQYYLDINGDGTPDFILSNFYFSSSSGALAQVFIEPLYSNQVGAYFKHRIFQASALLLGATIPAGKSHDKRARMAYKCYGPVNCNYFWPTKSGPWFGVHNRYLGLVLKSDGETHYGWARLDVQSEQNPAGFVVRLTGYAYETVPDQPITAGAMPAPISLTYPQLPPPPTLGMLATGAPGLPIWRSKKFEEQHRATEHSLTP